MNFLQTFKDEFKTIFTDAAIILTIIGGVILYAFLYPQPYVKQSVTGLSISVVDYDKSDVSRNMIFQLNATPQITVTHQDMSEKDAKESLLKGEVKAIIIIPAHFKRDIALNKRPTIALGADSSYFLIYGGILEGTLKTLLTNIATMKVANLLKKEVPLTHAKNAYTPYVLKVINLFNPQNSYTQYVIPAVFVLILQQTLLIGLGILGGGINEHLRGRKQTYAKTVPIFYMFLSRYIIFGVLFFIHMLFYFGFSFELFHITHLAQIKEILAFGCLFLLASISLGLLLGTLFNSREIATPVILFSSLPLVFSAGFIWPVEELPNYIVLLSLLAPSTSAIHGFLALNQMGAGLGMLQEQMTILLLQSIVYLFLAYLIFQYKRKKYHT
ncbi:MAG TPA: ABC transporter permease [Epsilonproteobacteria bacterium]|nr:ABC transporter permease [Campylobacterota bacterium]